MAAENDSKNKRGRTVETDRVNRILENEVFREHLGKNKEAEKDRIFCRHDMVHFLDVARIGMIFNLRENLQIPEDLLLIALHNIFFSRIIFFIILIFSSVSLAISAIPSLSFCTQISIL